jgi:hypothetical protein
MAGPVLQALFAVERQPVALPMPCGRSFTCSRRCEGEEMRPLSLRLTRQDRS